MNNKDRQLAQQIYLYLAALFITSLVVSNLIFQKFFYWYPFEWEVYGFSLFELSVGILPYPITFLITDLISEIYGQKKANQVVVAGIFASFFQWPLYLSPMKFQLWKHRLLMTKYFLRYFRCRPSRFWRLCWLICLRSLLISEFIIFGNATQTGKSFGYETIFPPFHPSLSILLR